MAERRWPSGLSLRLALLTLALAGCTVSGTGVLLTVRGPAGVDALEVTATYDGGDAIRMVRLDGVTLPAKRIFVLPDRLVTVDIQVVGLAQGQPVGVGRTDPITVMPRRVPEVEVTLGGDADLGTDLGTDGPPSNDLGIVPFRKLDTPVGSGTLRGVWSPSTAEVYVTCSLCTGFNLLRSIDQGANFTTHLVDTVNLNGVWGGSAADVYLVGAAGRVLRGSGTSFVAQAHPAGAVTMNAVSGPATDDVYVVGSGNTLLDWVPGAPGAWVSRLAIGTTVLNDVWSASANDVYVVGSAGTILRSIDKGVTWMSQTSGVAVELTSVWGSGAGDVWVVGRGGTVLHSTGNGVWSPAAEAVPAVDLFGVWGSSASDVWAVGKSGTILHSTGGAWSLQGSGTTLDLHRVFGTSAADIWVVGSGQIILHRP